MARITLWLCAALIATLAAPTAAAPGGPGAYKITGVAVDVVAANPTAARAAAYAIAERRAWPQLWARITGGNAASAPRLGDGAIEAMVAGVEIETEQFSLTRYIGRLSIVFDRNRTSGILGGEGGDAPPLLLLPVFIDGAGVRTVYQAKTPWSAAWLRFRDAASAVDYVIPAANTGDNVVLTAFQARRSDRGLWRTILARFNAADVLTAEIRLVRAWPGGPVNATAIARHGPDAVELGRVTLRAATPAGVDAMLDEAVRAVDAIYVRSLANGALKIEKGLTIELAPALADGPEIGNGGLSTAMSLTDANVATPDAKSWATIEADLLATPGVVGVMISRLALGSVSHIVIRHSDGEASLAYHLDRKGWRLAPDVAGVLLRRRIAGDPVVAPPPTAADFARAEGVGDADAAVASVKSAPRAPLGPKPGAAPVKPRDPLAPD